MVPWVDVVVLRPLVVEMGVSLEAEQNDLLVCVLLAPVASGLLTISDVIALLGVVFGE